MKLYNIDDEALRPYFELNAVLKGAFLVAEKLYGLRFEKIESVPVYHKDVAVYNVLNESGEHQALFYADFFPRSGKRSGAWMTQFKGQFKENGVDHRPQVSIV